MSRSTGQPGQAGAGADQQHSHIAFDFTVPSQENEYHPHPMSLDSQQQNQQGQSSQHVTPLRRKRSVSSREEDEDEDEDEDDEYMPEGVGGGARGNQYYPGGDVGSYQRGGSGSARGGPSGFDPMGSAGPSSHGRTASIQSGTQRKGQQQQAGVGPDGQPPPKKKRRRQALSCTGESRSLARSLKRTVISALYGNTDVISFSLSPSCTHSKFQPDGYYTELTPKSSVVPHRPSMERLLRDGIIGLI